MISNKMMPINSLVVVVVACLLFPYESQALENGLARRPPMGWLAWERFTCQVDCVKYPNDCVNARLFKQMAKVMASENWLELGYEYLHIDDCWSEMKRDEQNERLVADTNRFSEGIRSLAEYVHKLDKLKLGIYGDCGTRTCAGYPAQLRHNDSQLTERKPLKAGQVLPLDQADDDAYLLNQSTYFNLDAQTLADWHVDSLKFDGCHIDPLRAERICSRMSQALEATRRPILLICEWPFYMMYAHASPDFQLASSSCNVWRYYDDIEDSWLSILNTIDHTIRHQSTILKYHGPGHWFDPDQLVIGNFGLSVAQARAQMALWCVWAAPLYMSNDLRSIKPEFKEILQNKQLIAINQDPLGVFGQMVAQAHEQTLQAFVKPVLPVRNGCPSFAIVYLNRKTLGNREKVSFKVLDLVLGAPIGQAAINQEQVRAFEQKRVAQSDDMELDQLFGSQLDGETSDEANDDELIRPSQCLKRLAQDSSNIQFEVIDLFAGHESPIETLDISATLDLLVGPSSVGAVKLVEK